MFGLFGPKVFRDPQVGELRRSRGHWKGELAVPHFGKFHLSLFGNSKEPDQIALILAKKLTERFPYLTPEIQGGLFEHYSPYREAVDAGEYTGSPCPNVSSPADVWPHVKPVHVLIEPQRGVWGIEIAFRAAWDIEHTVAARFQDWKFVELNGSVRPE